MARSRLRRSGSGNANGVCAAADGANAIRAASQTASSSIRRDGTRAPRLPRLRQGRLTVGNERIGPAGHEPAGHTGLTLSIGAVGAIAGILVPAALGTPGIVVRRGGGDGGEGGKECRAEAQKSQLRLAHYPNSLSSQREIRAI